MEDKTTCRLQRLTPKTGSVETRSLGRYSQSKTVLDEMVAIKYSRISCRIFPVILNLADGKSVFVIVAPPFRNKYSWGSVRPSWCTNSFLFSLHEQCKYISYFCSYCSHFSSYIFYCYCFLVNTYFICTECMANQKADLFSRSFVAGFWDDKSTLWRQFKSSIGEGRGCVTANCRPGYCVYIRIGQDKRGGTLGLYHH